MLPSEGWWWQGLLHGAVAVFSSALVTSLGEGFLCRDELEERGNSEAETFVVARAAAVVEARCPHSDGSRKMPRWLTVGQLVLLMVSRSAMLRVKQLNVRHSKVHLWLRCLSARQGSSG